MNVPNEKFFEDRIHQPGRTSLFRKLLNGVYYLAGAFFVFVAIVSMNQKRISQDNVDERKRSAEQAEVPPKAIMPTAAQERGIKIMEAATLDLRRCIRISIAPAYTSGVYGKTQFMTYIKARCYPDYSARFSDSGLGDLQFSESFYLTIVEQEIASQNK